MRLLFLLALCLPPTFGLDTARVEQLPVGGVPLQDVVRQRAGEHLDIAEAAEKLSKATATAVLVVQQRLTAEMAMEEGEKGLEHAIQKSKIGQAAAEEAARYYEEAKHHAEHVHSLLDEVHKLPKEAAEQAAHMVEEQLDREAAAAAEGAKQAELSSRDEEIALATRVAAAAEPFHLAQLKAQKDMAVADFKARSAANATANLRGHAQRLAATAKVEWAAGLTLKANYTMRLAREEMDKAVRMRAFAKQLYKQATDLNLEVAHYQQLQQQAAGVAGGSPMLGHLPNLFAAKKKKDDEDAVSSSPAAVDEAAVVEEAAEVPPAAPDAAAAASPEELLAQPPEAPPPELPPVAA